MSFGDMMYISAIEEKIHATLRTICAAICIRGDFKSSETAMSFQDDEKTTYHHGLSKESRSQGLFSSYSLKLCILTPVLRWTRQDPWIQRLTCRTTNCCANFLQSAALGCKKTNRQFWGGILSLWRIIWGWYAEAVEMETCSYWRSKLVWVEFG